MGVLDQIFGSELPLAVRFLIAFAVVLGLIALTAWLVRRLAGRKLPIANAGRARQPRLGVLDAFAIDARRRLVLIRRDNVEHLIMIGGPNDLVVESQIVRAPAQGALAPQRAGGRQAPGEAARAAVAPIRSARTRPRDPWRRGARHRPRPRHGAAARPRSPPPPANAAPEPPPVKPGFFRATINRPATNSAAVGPRRHRLPPGDPRPHASPSGLRNLRGRRRPRRRSLPRPPCSAKPKAEVDPLFADIERQLEQALGRTGGAPATPLQAPAPAARPAALPRLPAPRRAVRNSGRTA